MKRNLYLQLDYDDYKSLERQLRSWDEIETSHETTDEAGRYYHKAIRLNIGDDLTLEFQGPLVKEPLRS